MRVIAGRLGGRTFDSPLSSRTHPMADKVRGALFNALGDIEGLTFLDAFAGSGALSYEALSRGALSVLAIERDNKAQATIKKNMQSLQLPSAMKLVSANCSSWSDTNQSAIFDIVLSAPPYDDLQRHVVEKLVRHTKAGGLYVLDWPGKAALPALTGLELLTSKNYGDAQLAFYRQSH